MDRHVASIRMTSPPQIQPLRRTGPAPQNPGQMDDHPRARLGAVLHGRQRQSRGRSRAVALCAISGAASSSWLVQRLARLSGKNFFSQVAQSAGPKAAERQRRRSALPRSGRRRPPAPDAPFQRHRRRREAWCDRIRRRRSRSATVLRGRGTTRPHQCRRRGRPCDCGRWRCTPGFGCIGVTRNTPEETKPFMNEHLGVAPHIVEAVVNHVSGPAKQGVAGGAVARLARVSRPLGIRRPHLG